MLAKEDLMGFTENQIKAKERFSQFKQAKLMNFSIKGMWKICYLWIAETEVTLNNLKNVCLI